MLFLSGAAQRTDVVMRTPVAVAGARCAAPRRARLGAASRENQRPSELGLQSKPCVVMRCTVPYTALPAGLSQCLIRVTASPHHRLSSFSRQHTTNTHAPHRLSALYIYMVSLDPYMTVQCKCARKCALARTNHEGTLHSLLRPRVAPLLLGSLRSAASASSSFVERPLVRALV